nr:MAG TPA: Helix-turn-helix XRE-family like protein [Caudoviricetes sp.]
MVVRTKRMDRNITQEELAQRLGVSQQAIAKWENGSSQPRTALLPKLADILGCTVDELLRGGEADGTRTAARTNTRIRLHAETDGGDSPDARRNSEP